MTETDFDFGGDTGARITMQTLRETNFEPSRNGDEAHPAELEDSPFHENGAGRDGTTFAARWYVDAADLLAEADPGPTPWLIDNLIVDLAIVAAVGRWKTSKSYGLLDLAIAVATGRPAFGELAIPKPGPVVFVNEESGRAALWRRLDALCRGRAIDPEELRGRLLVAPNARVKLDDPSWQNDLADLGREIRPRLFIFDPLARMKAPTRDESAQKEMAGALEFLRDLRDETRSSVCFVHHTGHTGGHMRGSSDLESVWETRLTWKRDGQAPVVTVESEHREAEAGEPISYRIGWDHDTRTMRFELVELADDDLPPLDQRIADWLREHPNQRAEEIAKGIQTRAADVRRTLERMKAGTSHGTTHAGPSGRRDAAGRPIRDKVWNLTEQATFGLDVARPEHGTTQDKPGTGHRGPSRRPGSLDPDGTDEPPDAPARTQQ